MKEIKCSLILPCYNEYKNLQFLEDTIKEIPDLIQGEIILVNNGSSDQTADFIKSLQKTDSRIVLVNVYPNIGYGNGILQGIKVARGKLIGWSHSDGQYDLRDSAFAFNMLLNKPDMDSFLVMGTRYGRPLIDRFFTRGMAIFESILFTTWLNDITAQPKIMSKKFFDGLKNPPIDFSLDLYVYLAAKKRKMKIFRFTTELNPRKHGVSSWNTGLISRFKLIKRTVMYSIRLRMGMEK